MKLYQEAAEWLLAVGIRYTWRVKKNKISIECLEDSDVTTINQLENGTCGMGRVKKDAINTDTVRV